jgi:hypothetical protein
MGCTHPALAASDHPPNGQNHCAEDLVVLSSIAAGRSAGVRGCHLFSLSRSFCRCSCSSDEIDGNSSTHKISAPNRLGGLGSQAIHQHARQRSER